jgi:phosphohistidine phosphatase
MKLYLVQHGEAVPKEVNPERPLNERGRADVARIASFLGTAGIRVATVLHSGKRRAEQTAELLAAAVGAGARLGKVSGIDPLDPTEEFARMVNDRTEDMMVVGHLPFMAKLVSRLIVGDEAASTVAFQPGAIVCLERTEEGDWSVAWMLRPGLVVGRATGKP